MSKKYKKEKIVMVDLSDRRNIKIIKSEKTGISDEEMKMFEKKLEIHSAKADEFCEYFINKELENHSKISDEDFNCTMKELFKQHKILKSLVNKEDATK